MTEATNVGARAGKEARAAVMGRIWEERDRQDALWPWQAPGGGVEPDAASVLLAILTKEVGEVAKALLEGKAAEMRTELIHTAAVCVKWVEIMDATAAADENRDVPTDQELGAAITDPGDDGSGWG